LHNFDKTLWPKCHIQWLYLAAHGCKTYLNLNLYVYTALLTYRPLTAASKCESQHGYGDSTVQYSTWYGTAGRTRVGGQLGSVAVR
jgi:hypothetical protein